MVLIKFRKKECFGITALLYLILNVYLQSEAAANWILPEDFTIKVSKGSDGKDVISTKGEGKDLIIPTRNQWNLTDGCYITCKTNKKNMLCLTMLQV